MRHNPVTCKGTYESVPANPLPQLSVIKDLQFHKRSVCDRSGIFFPIHKPLCTLPKNARLIFHSHLLNCVKMKFVSFSLPLLLVVPGTTKIAKLSFQST